jgi:hypothetical protein
MAKLSLLHDNASKGRRVNVKVASIWMFREKDGVNKGKTKLDANGQPTGFSVAFESQVKDDNGKWNEAPQGAEFMTIHYGDRLVAFPNRFKKSDDDGKPDFQLFYYPEDKKQQGQLETEAGTDETETTD